MVRRIVSPHSPASARAGTVLPRRAQVWLLASLPILCGACIPQSVYTTHNVALPVMLGPVRTLRSHHDHGAEVATFSAETQHAFAVSSSTTQQGSYQVTTTTTSIQHEDSTKFDAATAAALTQCVTCSVKTDRVRVGSYYIYWLVAIMSKNWAGMNGSLHTR